MRSIRVVTTLIAQCCWWATPAFAALHTNNGHAVESRAISEGKGMPLYKLPAALTPALQQ
jgi:hypothetical protein